MKPGRNDPCPCGSGRKYKKCCLHGQPIAAQPPSATAPPAAARPPPSLSQLLTPYVIGKMAEDPRQLDNPELRPYVERFLRDHWTIAKVAALTTEQIEAQLRAFGVAYTQERFLAQADGRTEAWPIADAWQQTDRVTCRGKEADFLGLAACELWKRLLPDRPSMEMLDDWMQDGYALQQQDREAEACDLWWRVWQTLLPQFTADMREMNDVLPAFRGLQSVFNWSQDFCRALTCGQQREPHLAEVGVRYCSQWLGQFTGEGDRMRRNFVSHLAEFQLHCGDVQGTDATLAQLVQAWPDDPWSYVAVADTCTFIAASAGRDRDVVRAEAVLRRGLEQVVAGHPDRFVLEERLEALRSGR